MAPNSLLYKDILDLSARQPALCRTLITQRSQVQILPPATTQARQDKGSSATALEPLIMSRPILALGSGSRGWRGGLPAVPKAWRIVADGTSTRPVGLV